MSMQTTLGSVDRSPPFLPISAARGAAVQEAIQPRVQAHAQAQSQLCRMHDDPAGRVASYLTAADALNLRQACRKLSLLAALLRRELSLGRSSGASPDDFLSIAGNPAFSKLVFLDCTGVQLDARHVLLLDRFALLRELRLPYVADLDPRALRSLHKLQTLVMAGCVHPTGSLRELPRGLKTLDLSAFKLRSLSELTHLAELQSFRCGAVVDFDFTPLGALPSLTQLRLRRLDPVNDVDLAHLSTLPLTLLELNLSKVSEGAIAGLPRTLTTFFVEGVPAHASLSHLDQLATLSLSSAWALGLDKLPCNLKVLAINGPLRKNQLHYLGSMSQLSSLSILDAQHDEVWAELDSLELPPSLEELCLSPRGVYRSQDAILHALPRHTQLKWIYVNSFFSEQAVSELSQAMPQTEVFYDDELVPKE